MDGLGITPMLMPIRFIALLTILSCCGLFAKERNAVVIQADFGGRKRA